MTDVQILAGDLTANIAERVVSGLLLPFGELGNTNLGKFEVPGPGIISIPPDVSVLMANEGHSQLEPRAAFLTATESDGGVFASFRVGKNPEGDELLARIEKRKSEGKPMALSVEVKGVVIRAGKAVAGRLTGAAFVDRGAFPSAALMAADVGETVEIDGIEVPAESKSTSSYATTGSDGSEYSDSSTTTEEAEDLGNGKKRITRTTVTVTEVTDPEEAPAKQKEDAVAPAATAPDLLHAHHAPAEIPGQGMKLADLFAKLAEATRTKSRALYAELQEELEAGAELYATLSDVKTTGTGGLAPTMSQPQWLGELWGRRRFQRRYIPLFAHGDLSAFTVAAWKWTVKPTMAAWTGNKTAVPSNTPTVDPYSVDAVGWAGGHDIDRRFKDFEVPGFWESYFDMMTDSYSELSDEHALASAIAGATAVTAGAVPSGIDPGIVSIVDGALSVLDYGLPTFAIVAKNVYRSILLTPKDKIVEYLSQAMGLEEGTLDGFKIIPARGTDVAAGKVLVGVGNAVEVLELPGSPIRVEGLDMVKGGIDTGVFGYSTEVIHRPEALAIVTPAA